MNDNINNWIDDWLNSLGSDSSPVPNNIPAQPTEPTPQEETVSLTESEFDDILQENGFEDFSDAEEIVEDNNIQTEAPAIDNNDGSLRIELPSDEIIEATTILNDHPIENPEITTGNSEEQAIVPSESSEVQEPLLPPNSPTLLMDSSTSRFSGTEWYNKIQSFDIILAGIGGIGSNTAFQIARLHPNLMVLYDDDTVETVNMSGQLFSGNDIGRNKVDAIGSFIRAYTTITGVYTIKKKFENRDQAGDIMICGFDNMAARKTFFNAWKSHVEKLKQEDKKNCLYIDGRLSIDTIQILCITGDDEYNMQRYEKEFLFSDAEADETICSMKQTTYLACMIGSLITNLLTNFAANLLDSVMPYDLPFFTEYDAQNMIFKTEN